MPMNQDDLLLYLNAAEANSIHASDEINSANQKAFDYYSMGPMGNEVQGESKVKSTDVFDLVESDMPSHVRTFLGANEIMAFKPINDSEAERKQAEEKTKYINHLVRNQPTSYSTLFSWFKGATMYKYSAVKYGFEEEETVKTIEYIGVDDEELALINIELGLQRESGAEIDYEELEREENDNLKNVQATIKKKVGRYFVRYVEPESFVITSGSTSVQDAEMTGDDEYLTKLDLMALGYSEEIVKDLPASGNDNERRDSRIREQGGNDDGNSSSWKGEIVKVENRYLRVDKDGDGIAERLHIVRVGDEILSDEPYEIAPYAVLSSIMMPGVLISNLSRADAAMETQDIKTALLRQTMMNMYNVNAARMAVNKNVNLDDLLTVRIGGAVRVKGDGNPLEHMAPLPVPFIGDKALMVLQYADAARAQRTGSLLANQALDADKLHKETATRFEGVADAAAAKVELVQRGFAETGIRDLFMGLLWTVSHFQKERIEIMVLDKPLTIDPRRWLSDQPVVSNVGLGAGDEETVIQNMSALFAIHEQLRLAGSPLTDQKKVYNIMSKAVKAMNQSDVGQFFNDPEVPAETLQAQVEQLQMMNMQMQQALQAAQNPLADAERIKAQASLIEAQAKQETADAKQRSENAQFAADLEQKMNQFIADLEFKYTQLEAETNKDIPGSRI